MALAKGSTGETEWQVRDALRQQAGNPLGALHDWARQQGLGELEQACLRFAEESLSGLTRLLPGPTGERNSYSLLPRSRVLCLAADDSDLLLQLAAVMAVGSTALIEEAHKATQNRLPQAVRSRVQVAADWRKDEVAFEAVLHHGDSDQLRQVCQQVAKRNGPIVGVQGLARGETAIPLERLLIERALSVNTAAAGGNASLMTIG
ncbi:delta 1-pyrroline-5-carboxylate dehydrogenase [Pseudomonas sp. SORGH_AS199]|nr:delta 1-pyrroline-5-carboxylate dehydrogenase [Pseudomonas sp. SORGH_AS_0199]